MMHYLTLVADPAHRLLDDDAVRQTVTTLTQVGATCGAPVWLNPDIAADIPFSDITDELAENAIRALFGEDFSQMDFDYAVTEAENRRKRVLVADMDSTMIEIETLDTLADQLGFGPEVEAITARSMNGELDFVESLKARVALLKGQAAEAAMNAVMNAITYTPGGSTAVRTMAANGAVCALVSGGFTFTTEAVHKRLGFHIHRANTLEVENGTLTGRIIGDIVGRPAKLETLHALCAQQAVGYEAACAVGDGANDLDMLKAAGLGVGFRPKPIVEREARYSIRRGDLTALLYYQGYRAEEFVHAQAQETV